LEYKYDVQLMVKVAQLYYVERLKQEEIARKLDMSRSFVSMILSEAMDKGIVEIKIRDPRANNEDIAAKFEQIFSLNKCYIISTSIKQSDTVRAIVAQRTVEVFNELIQDGNTVGLAWGRTCYEFIAKYEAAEKPKGINVVPLIGGSDQRAKHFQINEMVRLFAEKIYGTPTFIHAPALTASVEDRNLFMASSVMEPVLEKWRSLDVVVTGIGAPPGTLEARDGKPSFWHSARPRGEEAFVDNLISKNAVGDICAQYYDINGQFISGVSENIIGVSQVDLYNANTVIGFAGGTEKALSIIGALRTKVIDIFICDEQTAIEVLNRVE
jgi:deoxyribonucleoside regulator